jgi:hypothetical protein
MIMHDIKMLNPQPFSSIADLCNALSSVGICGTICQELESTLQEMVTRHGGEEHILKHGLDFWAAQILQNGAQRVMDFRNGCFGESRTLPESSGAGSQHVASIREVDASTDYGRSGKYGSDNAYYGNSNASRFPGDGESAGTQRHASMPEARQVRVLTRPMIPLDQNAELGLPPMPALNAMVDPAECPEYVHFFHGCPWIEALAGIKRDGVTTHQPHGGFYSSCPASYWTTSSAFAIWWCATLQAKERAVNEGVWRSLNNQEQHIYKCDAVPESLNEVPCLVVQSTWSKADLYQMHIYVLDPDEEDEVTISTKINHPTYSQANLFCSSSIVTTTSRAISGAAIGSSRHTRAAEIGFGPTSSEPPC